MAVSLYTSSSPVSSLNACIALLILQSCNITVSKFALSCTL